MCGWAYQKMSHIGKHQLIGSASTLSVTLSTQYSVLSIQYSVLLSPSSTLSVPLWPFIVISVIRLPSAESFAARPTYTDLSGYKLIKLVAVKSESGDQMKMRKSPLLQNLNQPLKEFN